MLLDYNKLCFTYDDPSHLRVFPWYYVSFCYIAIIRWRCHFMLVYEFSIDQPVSYHFTGKFKSPEPQWKHDELPLDDYEIILVTDGTLYLQYLDHKYEVRKGEVLLLPPSAAGCRKGYRPSDCSFYWLHFICTSAVSCQEMDSSLQLQGSPLNRGKIFLSSCFTVTRLEKIVVLLKQLQDAVRFDSHPLILNYMTTIVLLELYQQFYSQMSYRTSAVSSKSQVYHDIVDYVNRNMNKSITVSQIAEEFGFNEKYLSHMFSSISGMPLKQFILQSKINEANFLLSDTNMQIAEISAALGFSDPHVFMKSYKRITGLTPTEYRNAFSRRMLFHK